MIHNYFQVQKMTSPEEFLDIQVNARYDTSNHQKKRQRTSQETEWGNIQPIINAGGFRTHLLATNCKEIPFVQEAYAQTKGMLNLTDIPKCEPQRSSVPEAVLNNMFKQLQRSQLLSYQRIFSVPKANSELHRLIGHPRDLNNVYVAPHFSLVPFTEIPELLRVFGSEFHAIEFDFTNYFPQIPIGHNLSTLLGVIANNRSYGQKVLSQGWSGSTFIAQCFTWGFISLCSKRHSLSKNIILELQKPSPPSHLALAEVTIVFCTTTYSSSAKTK